MWTDVDAHTSRWDRHIRIHRGTHRKMGCNTDAVDTGRWGSETHTRQMVVAPRLVLMLPQRDNHVLIRTLTRADATRVDNSRTPAFSFQTQNTHKLDCQTSHGRCFCGTIWLHADDRKGILHRDPVSNCRSVWHPEGECHSQHTHTHSRMEFHSGMDRWLSLD